MATKSLAPTTIIPCRFATERHVELAIDKTRLAVRAVRVSISEGELTVKHAVMINTFHMFLTTFAPRHAFGWLAGLWLVRSFRLCDYGGWFAPALAINWGVSIALWSSTTWEHDESLFVTQQRHSVFIDTNNATAKVGESRKSETSYCIASREVGRAGGDGTSSVRGTSVSSVPCEAVAEVVARGLISA